LVAVLWLIAILALASITALRVIGFDMSVASAKIHGSKALQLAEKGIAIGSHPQVKRGDPLLHQYDGETEEGLDVKITSEGGRFNINGILMQRDSDLLNTLFTSWGLKLEESQALVDALTDWTDADDDVSLNGAEREVYEDLGRTNQPFNRQFYDISEMRLVRGMERVEALQPRWADWFTVWSGGKLDLNDAPAERIAIAAECPIEQAQMVCDSVCGEDGIRDTEDDMPFQTPAAAFEILGLDPDQGSPLAARFTVNDPATRIESIGRVTGAKRKITIILRNRTGKPALLERTESIIP
jgi:hypothetical protein